MKEDKRGGLWLATSVGLYHYANGIAKKVGNSKEVIRIVWYDNDHLIVSNAKSVSLVDINTHGANTGTITDVNGKFKLDVKPQSTLDISYIGYKTQSVVSTGQKEMKIQLQPSSTQIDEVVVIGYGTAKKVTLPDQSQVPI